MTRIAAILRRDGNTVPPEAIDALLRAAELPASATRTVLSVGPAALGALGGNRPDAEPGPFPAAARDSTLLFDGRLDNRHELEALLESSEASQRLADGALVHLLLLERGEAALRDIRGPFALVVLQAGARRLLLARDPLGSRTLHYCVDARRVAATTRPAGLLALEGSGAELDEETLARYLALRGPRPGATFFSGVREVEPGHLVEVDASSVRSRRFDRIEPQATGPTRDEEIEERLRELLDDAVRVRMRGGRRLAIQMSGGLDSTSVAALAANALPPGERLTTISYVFEELASIDERRWIRAMSDRWRLDSTCFAGDSFWSFRDGTGVPAGLGSPFTNLYGALRRRMYELLLERGTDVLLTGDFGDDLWRGGVGWLRDLVRRGRLGEALAGAARSGVTDLRGPGAGYSLRASLGFLLRPTSARREAKWAARMAPWLTPRGREVSGLEGWTRTVEEELSEVPEAARGHLGTHQLAQVAVADDEADRLGISIGRPFRDRRLVEFVLGLPAATIYRPGSNKRLLRRAMSALLPTELTQRRVVTSMTPLCDRGLGEREWPRVREILAAPDALWPRYVDRTFLWRVAPDCFRSRTESIARLVVWHCLCLECWRREVQACVARISLPR